MPVWSRAFLLPFGLAAAVTLAAALVALGVVTRLPGNTGVPLFIFVFSTAVAGYAGGLASGLLAVAFSLAVGLYVVVPPTSLPSVSAAPLVVVMFAAVLFLTALMAGRLRAARQAQTAARGRAEEMAKRLRAVTAVGEAPLASQQLDGLLTDLLTNARRILAADTAAVLLREEARGTETEDTLLVRAAVGLEQEVERGARIPFGGGFAGRIAAEARPVILDDVRPDHVLNPILREKGVRSLLGVPMIVEGRVVGVLHVGTLQRRIFTADDAQLLRLVADRIALAIEHVRQFEAQERRAESLSALVKVATDIHGAGRIEEVMQAIAETAARLAGGGVAFAGFFRGRGEPDPTEYQQWEVSGYPREAFQHLDRLHLTPLFAPTFRAQGTVRSDDIRTHPLFRGLPEGHVPVVSYLAVPVVSRSAQSLGAILLGHPEPGRFDDHVQTQVESLARQAGVALENALLYERERSTAATLQRSLLPAHMPDIPGISLAVRYLASGTGEVGGDWYDVFELGDGNLALVMGDVVGRGVPAAAIMGQLRNALRAYALEDARPQAVAERLNLLSERLGAPNLVTLAYVLLDLSTLTARYIRAGHLPPVIITPDGTATSLEDGHALPLGVNRNAAFSEGQARLRPGSTLLIYTDGLVDHPDVPLEEALLRLREVALGAHARGPEVLLDELLQKVLPASARHDDVAVLALHVVPQGDRMTLRVSAEPSSAAVIRQAMRRWFAEQGIAPEAAFPLLVATGEAISNAVEHAYGPSGGQLQLDVSRAADEVTITVRDFGQWRPTRGTDRGRGFRLMEGMVDEVAVSHEQEGTEVRLRRRVLDGTAS